MNNKLARHSQNRSRDRRGYQRHGDGLQIVPQTSQGLDRYRESWLRLGRYPRGYHSEERWIEAADRFAKSLHRYLSYKGYVEHLFRTIQSCSKEDVMIDQIVRELELWKPRIVELIAAQASTILIAASSRSIGPSALRSREAVACRGSIRSWIRPYRQLLRLKFLEEHDIPFFYMTCDLGDGRALPEDLPPFMTIAERLQDIARGQAVALAAQSMSRGKRIPASNVHPQFGQIYTTVVDVEELQLDVADPSQYDRSTLRINRIRGNALDLMSFLEEAIVTEGSRRFGGIGDVVARDLIGKARKATIPAQRRKYASRGKPTDVLRNRIILRLHDAGLDRYLIRRLLNGLEAKVLATSDGGPNPWNLETEAVRRKSEGIADQTVGKQISDLGGSLPRYEAQLMVDKLALCRQCTWDWDRDGTLVRTKRCSSHKRADKRSLGRWPYDESLAEYKNRTEAAARRSNSPGKAKP